MRLEFVPLDKLSVSKTNMRWSKKAPDVSDILPSVRKRGVIQPVIVRPNCDPDAYEVVGGARRYTAALIVADERIALGEAPEPMPCAILDDHDDASAIEASLIENLARLDPDEVRQWETFTRLVKEGRSVEDISLTFGLPDLTVKRVLALGNLLPRIRALYGAEAIDRTTVRHLTLASKRQQQDWLALYDDPQVYAPQGSNLKAWLLGGQSVPVAHALFEIEGSGLAIVADLFGDGACFADATAFWAAQNAAIETRRAAFVEAGWSDALILPPSDYFQSWEYEKTPKRKGGQVIIDVKASGEVVIHEGYVPRNRKAAKRGSGADGSAAKVERPEVTSALQTYIDLHRHAAVRADLTGHPGTALRLMVAHAIIGSPLFRVSPEPQTARDDDIRQSVFESPGEALFDERRRAVLTLIGASPDDPNVTGGNHDDVALVGLFERLMDVPDAALMDVIAIVMGESLAAGSAMVDAAALRIGTDMADWWQADTAFFGLVRDKMVLTAIMAEVAGDRIAEANRNEKGKAMKKIITDHLEGNDGRTRVERWVPKWIAFPPGAYTARGGVGSVRAHARALAGRDCALPEPEAEALPVAMVGEAEPEGGTVPVAGQPDEPGPVGNDAEGDEQQLAA